jgi:hypothetical protein
MFTIDTKNETPPIVLHFAITKPKALLADMATILAVKLK